MYEYFKMLEDYVQGIDCPYSSIKDITEELLKSGGYERKNVQFKNGNERERTVYSKKFDSLLVAKWILHYKNHFISRLQCRKDLEDYHIWIINSTFFKVFGCLKIDKISSDESISLYVIKSINSSIKQAIKMKLSSCVDDEDGVPISKTLSLDCLIDDHLYEPSEYMEDNIIAEINNALDGNDIGKRVFAYLLNSRTKADFRNIDSILQMSREECTEDNKEKIIEAINTIKRIIIEYSGINKRFKSISPSIVTYTFEE